MLNSKRLAVALLSLLLMFSSGLLTGCSSGPPKSTTFYYEAVEAVFDVAPSIRPEIGISESDSAPMKQLADNLKARGIGAGLVTVRAEGRSEGNLDACIAVSTVDRGTVFLYVVPQDLDVDASEVVQAVYMQNGSKVGFIPATLAESTDYAWYLSYLQEVYEYFDRCEWLAAFDKLITEYSSHLDRTIDYIEDPPLLTNNLSDSEFDTYDKLVSQAERNIRDYNSMTDTYNTALAEIEADAHRYPLQIFYVETIFSSPYLVIPTMPTFTLPPVPSVPLFPSTISATPSSYLSTLETLVRKRCPDIPDESSFHATRVTDENFVVDDYSIKW